jgi:dienelactone hydrolase
MKTLLLSLLAMASASAALVEKSVDYEHDGVTLEGFHVYDDAIEGKRPAVLVIHQWTGLTNYEKDRSRMLARLGYNVLAADIYGKGVRPVPPAAGQEAGKYKGNRELYRGRLTAGLEQLKKDERTDTGKVAAIGYCFGGTVALELARAGADLDAVASFHGALSTKEPALADKVKARIVAFNGAEDPMVPHAERQAFMKEMTDAGVDWQLVEYGHAVHAFTNPDADRAGIPGVAYNEKADQRSWEAMLRLFEDALGA